MSDVIVHWGKQSALLQSILQSNPSRKDIPFQNITAIDLVFNPSSDAGASADMSLGTEEPEIEPLIDGVVDLGALATEFLILGIDPYPRKPGAVFEAPPTGEPFAGPFAGLAALQKKPQK